MSDASTSPSTNPLKSPLTSTAQVATGRPARYRKQLGSHLGRNLIADVQQGRTHLTFPGEQGEAPKGSCALVEEDGILRLEAEGVDEAMIERVEHVVGGHLERFGEAEGLTVVWERSF